LYSAEARLSSRERLLLKNVDIGGQWNGIAGQPQPSGAGASWVTIFGASIRTAATKPVALPRQVSINRGLSAESPSACRSLLFAAFSPCSKHQFRSLLQRLSRTSMSSISLACFALDKTTVDRSHPFGSGQ
jgi:hypothetical protein